MTLSTPAGTERAAAEGLWAVGSVTGADHRRALRDGQDGAALLSADGIAVAVVTDGCGSGAHSEVGARLGARWVAQLALDAFAASDGPARVHAIATDVDDRLARRLGFVARSLSPRGAIDPRVVHDHLLFTYLALVVTSAAVIVFGVGDGVVWVDGRATVLEAPGDAPDYAAYRLLGQPRPPRVHLAVPRADVRAVAVGTDGLSPLAVAPALDALVRDPAFARNPSLLRKRLVVLADAGTLRDDATLAVFRGVEIAS
ncbi:MAG: protein phosphatase 2C domain-containing protein [Myxococcales bacterium]|nr:protein phosphatase 2C domain-containing protein [Myxococcales bacterium]